MGRQAPKNGMQAQHSLAGAIGSGEVYQDHAPSLCPATRRVWLAPSEVGMVTRDDRVVNTNGRGGVGCLDLENNGEDSRRLQAWPSGSVVGRLRQRGQRRASTRLCHLSWLGQARQASVNSIDTQFFSSFFTTTICPPPRWIAVSARALC